jgi:hypothetical protein
VNHHLLDKLLDGFEGQVVEDGDHVLFAPELGGKKHLKRKKT